MRHSAWRLCVGLLGCAAFSLSVTAQTAGFPMLEGKAGDGLLEALASGCAPSRIVTAYGGDSGKWALMESIDSDVDGRFFTDRFTGVPLPFGTGSDHVPSAGALVSIVDASWWKLKADGRTAAPHDLHNLWPSTPEVLTRKGALPPGMVDEPESAVGRLTVGWGELGGERCRMWQPPRGYEGDVARVLMYMLAVWHVGLEGWSGAGMRYVDSDEFPVLTDAGARQLLAWHRADPPDARELARSEAVAEVQGNRNPFVHLPQLAEYLWGYEAGEAFGGEIPENPPANPEDTSPLRARYALGDARINLRSPLVPEGCCWWIDGVAVPEPFVSPASLGVGRHELRFSGADVEGKVTIEITP